MRAGWISGDKRYFERREKTRYSERRVTFMDVGQNSPEVEVFEENIPNVHCRTSIALGELQLGGFQMGAGGCWAPLQWEVVSGWERLVVGPQLGPNTRNVRGRNKSAPTGGGNNSLASRLHTVAIWREVKEAQRLDRVVKGLPNAQGGRR